MRSMPLAFAVGALLLGSSPLARALEPDALTVWMSTDKGIEELRGIAAQFTEDLGIEVRFESPEPITEQFQKAAATADGPDIVLWAHDRFGEWASGGLIADVAPSAAVRDAQLPIAWEALTFDDRTWGYPIAVEAIGLIYNTDLVDTPPASFEEIATLTFEDGVTPIMWAYDNPYFSFPLMMAGGGFAFEKVDGSYVGDETGVNNAGAIAGAQAIRDLIEAGVMPAGVDYGVMDAAVNKGETAMVLSGPWAWVNLRQSGTNFAVAPLPTVGGEPARAFVGVYSAAINAASPNKDLAVEFIENYMLSDDGLAAWNANGALGALANAGLAEAQGADPNVAATIASATAGVPMPSNPEMGKFWSAMEPALAAITSGAQPVEAALNDAAARILAE